MIVVCASTQQVGRFGACSARKFFEMRCSKIASEALWENCNWKTFYSFSSMWDDGHSECSLGTGRAGNQIPNE